MGMGIQVLYLVIKIPHYLTVTIISNLVSHLVQLMFAALGLFKSLPDPDDDTSSSAAILILDGSSPSLLPVPVHVITAAIKNKVPIIPYGGADKPVCTVCLECVDGCDLIRELLSCKHVFHVECLDKWVDVGQVHCPLCRSMLLPPKKILSGIAPVISGEA